MRWPFSTATPAPSPPASAAEPAPADSALAGAATADYLDAKAPYLDYPTALEQGAPIATGVIEGARRHLLKDRTDITGARWGLPGAEAVSNSAHYTSTTTSTTTGATTSPRNTAASTKPTTLTAKYQQPHSILTQTHPNPHRRMTSLQESRTPMTSRRVIAIARPWEGTSPAGTARTLVRAAARTGP